MAERAPKYPKQYPAGLTVGDLRELVAGSPDSMPVVIGGSRQSPDRAVSADFGDGNLYLYNEDGG